MLLKGRLAGAFVVVPVMGVVINEGRIARIVFRRPGVECQREERGYTTLDNTHSRVEW